MNEAREIHPFTLFRLPGLGQEYVKDFRPMPVPVEAPPPVVEEAPDPKSHSSVMDSAAPFGDDSSQTKTNELMGSSSGSTENPVSAEKESQSAAGVSSIPPTLQLPGAGRLPAAPTGQTPSTEPPLTKTPSSPAEGSESPAP